MQVAIPLFPRFTALDGIGPYEVLQRIPDLDITFVGHDRSVVRSENGFLGIQSDATFEELAHPDIIVFPGGVGTRPLMEDERVLDWVRTAHATTTFTTSVCTGSLVLGAAGLLDGLTATTHWSVLDRLADLGAIPTSERVVEHLDRRIITAAGVSAGIDMALRLVELLFDRTAAEASQLMIEYDPQPPFDAGATHKVGDEVMTRVIEYAAASQLMTQWRHAAPLPAGRRVHRRALSRQPGRCGARRRRALRRGDAALRQLDQPLGDDVRPAADHARGRLPRAHLHAQSSSCRSPVIRHSGRATPGARRAAGHSATT